MDIASRFQPGRQRAPAYLDRNNSVAEDSGTECMPTQNIAGQKRDRPTNNEAAESFIRRKFQRTNAEASNPNDSTFRKPSIPASASRPQAEQRSSFTHNRRRSTALRENVRVPSGPREFPSPHKRVASGSVHSITPSMSEATNTSRTFLPQSATEPNFSKIADAPRFSFANRSSTDVADPTTTAAGRASNDLDFIPTVSFDDLQTSIANYDGDSPLLSDFPEVGGRPSTKQKTGNMLRDASLNASRPPVPKLEPRAEQSMSRSQSLRRRLSAVAGGVKSNNTPQMPNQPHDGNASQASNLSLRTRRQSTAPQGPPPAEPAPPPLGAGSRPSRKSLGPGVLASMMEGRKASQPLPSSGTDPALKSALARSGSLTKAQRRTTMQPSASGGAELPRVATFSATTQSRANKVKSLGPPAREPQEPNTPNGKTTTRSGQNRAHTPSSSGNKRQSTMSGRASGLGARTISPTDARRLKRLSMMQAPPLPSNPSTTSIPKMPAPAQEEQPVKPEVPRLAQPSPSFIPQPRRSSNATPSSARASPENRNSQQYGGVQLSARSSFSSLVNSGSTSRLPTPKPRSVHSSTAQYGEEEEVVPPVPAIPKAYESPRDADHPPFFSGVTKSQQNGSDAATANTEEVASNKRLSKLSAERPAEPKTRVSLERPRPHYRTNTMDNIERSIALTAAKPPRPQNNNLQPLRLPPLNLMPINHRDANRSNSFPRPSQELEVREDASIAQTPEPKRVAKTPSTPMTASKATFSGRQYDDFTKSKNMRSSSSHYALRDLMQLDDDTTRFFDDSDAEFMGVPIPSTKQRSAITPFSSGSLPKASGEFARQRGRPSGEYTGEYSISNFEEFQQQSAKPQGPRPSRSGTNNTIASYKTAETSSNHSPVEPAGQPEGKKESSGLRRKLSLGWRRSSSKSNIQTDNKSSPRGDGSFTSDHDKATLQKLASQMLPPKLPASATWAGDTPSIPPPSARPSFDSMRRKSTAVSTTTLPTTNGDADQNHTMPAIKTRSMHSEQPQPVNGSNRATSWSTINPTRPPTKAPPNLVKSRQATATPIISAIIKDKDDLAADDEMKRLSQKRKDVDTAAKDSEDLKRRAVARSPKSPEDVLHDRTAALNIFERGEIMDYENQGVYFTGTKNARKIIGSLTPSPQPGDKDPKAGNYGYDDERGDYNIVLGDHLAYRYEVVDVLGKGSFGQVVRCVDHKDGGIVAVKIIRNKKRFHQQALVEVGILGRLREWDPDQTHATLSITSSFYFRSHLCIVTPCLSINLYELIRAHNFVGFTLPLIRRFARQLLSCLVLLQNKQIIHCDLKPENILLCEARKADVRVIDFGSSCKESEKVYTYIQSRFYRSPEVILGSSYGLGIDMWSLGCILAELWTGYPLFPGENEQEQLACIMEIFGPPDRHLVERCTRKKLFFDSVGKPRVTVSSKGRRRRPSSKTLSQALKSEDEAFLDFIARCLRWDPDRRLKPHDAVNHPFITNQPFHQRSGGIPDEARRAARLRSTAAAPATNGGIPSPVKRTHTTTAATTSSGNAFAQQQAQVQQTPAKERSRPLPETPQTAVRNGGPVQQPGSTAQGSPSKRVPINRRESGVPAANVAPVAGAKRSNNGQVSIGSTSGMSFSQRQTSASSSNTTGSLAQMAAREANNAARWRI